MDLSSDGDFIHSRRPQPVEGEEAFQGPEEKPHHVVARVLDRILDSIKSKNKIGVKE